MIAPSTQMIEIASDSLDKVDDFIRRAQRVELASFGEERAKAIGATGLSEDFQRGYELGLQTARVFLAGNPAAIRAKVSL